MKKVLIIGVSGQDGSYLAQHLLSQKKYIVYGIVRKKNNKNLNKLNWSNGFYRKDIGYKVID